MYKTITYKSDEYLLEALRRGDREAFEFLYRQYYRMAARQANDQGLGDADTEDIFQEMLLILVQKVQDPGFRLTAKLGTYLFAVLRNLLFKKTGKKIPVTQSDDALLHLPESEPNLDRAVWEEKLSVVAGNLELLEDGCRTLLVLSFFEKRSQAEIAEAMGYAESFVKVKKHRCLEYLRKKVKAHPLFKDE